ncbi:MAG: MFS transporter, partial [Pseudomonadota bacterium]
MPTPVMLMRKVSTERRGVIVAILGLGQTVSWAGSYYIPAILFRPMAAELGVSEVWLFGLFSLSLTCSALVGPAAGRMIDRQGGRGVLLASNLVLAAGLGICAMSTTLAALALAWIVLGIGMGMGLYEAAFATAARYYGKDARGMITGITLIAGFASTVSWPISGALEAQFGWRVTCLIWMAAHVMIALPLHACLPTSPVTGVSAATDTPTESVDRRALWILSFIFAVAAFTSTAMATHLPAILTAAGASAVVAIGAGALIGPSQVVARISEHVFFRKRHPIFATRLGFAAHP